MEILADDPEFRYDGGAWGLSAAHTYPSGSRVTAAFFAAPLAALRIDMNGFSHEFMLAGSDQGQTLAQLTSGSGVATEPCDGGNERKPNFYRQTLPQGLSGTTGDGIAQTQCPPHRDPAGPCTHSYPVGLWGEITDCGDDWCESLYLFDGLLLLLQAGREPATGAAL